MKTLLANLRERVKTFWGRISKWVKHQRDSLVAWWKRRWLCGLIKFVFELCKYQIPALQEFVQEHWARLKRHILTFWVVWLLLAVLTLLSILFHGPRWLIYIVVALFVLHMGRKPMSTVYGLVGGSASIKTFLFNFLFVTILFSVVYQCLFFTHAGVCYDSDTPKLDYALFEKPVFFPSRDTVLLSYDTVRTSVLEERTTDSTHVAQLVVQTRVDTITLTYHSVNWGLMLENALLTSLTQAPSDLFFALSDFGENMNTIAVDKSQTTLFSTILLLHVLISWIFLGVFISLLYSKFRYEA